MGLMLSDRSFAISRNGTGTCWRMSGVGRLRLDGGGFSKASQQLPGPRALGFELNCPGEANSRPAFAT